MSRIEWGERETEERGGGKQGVVQRNQKNTEGELNLSRLDNQYDQR